MSREEWFDFCRIAWSEPYYYIQINRLEDIKSRYSIRNVNNDYIKTPIPETNPFRFFLSMFITVGIVAFLTTSSVFDMIISSDIYYASGTMFPFIKSFIYSFTFFYAKT